MRSDAQAITSVSDQYPIFQIGKRVFLSVERASGDAAAAELGDARSIDIAAGEYVFRLHQMRENARPPALLPAVADGINSLPAMLSLSAEDWHHFLRNLFGIAAGVLRLGGDEQFISVAARLLKDAPRQLEIGLHQVTGAKGKVAIVSRRANLLPDELLLFFDENKLTVGRIEAVEDVLLHPAARDRLVGVKSSGGVVGPKAMLLGAKVIARVDVDVHTYASFEEFYRKHERENFDLVSLLFQVNGTEAALPPDIFDERRVPNRFHDQRLNVRFELTNGFSLDNGFFVSGWFFDQEEQLSEIVVVDHALQQADLMGSWKVFHGRVELDSKVAAVRRFVAFIPRRPGQRAPDEVRIRVSLKSGPSYILAPKSAPKDVLSRRDAILHSIGGYAFSLDQFNDVFRPAIRPLQERLNSFQRVREKRELGNRSARTISIIIPIYREIDFLRSQLMAFALDKYMRDQCEIIYCVDDPTIALPFLGAVTAYSAALPLDVKVLIMDRNGGYALANNFAASAAAGETLVLLNSDVIPLQPGWVKAGVDLLDALPQHSVIGPKLLYPDYSIQHAGMYFQRTANRFWQNVHFSKGYGRDLPSANIDREVPAITGACMFIRKADYLEVGGFSDDYIVGDFEDSDLCLKLRTRGGIAFYAASIELYHFERQSMNVAGGPSQSPSTLYNEALHASKWDTIIPSVNEVAIAYGNVGVGALLEMVGDRLSG